MVEPGAILRRSLEGKPQLERLYDEVSDQARQSTSPEVLADWHALCDRFGAADLGHVCLLSFLRGAPACARRLGHESAITLGETAIQIAGLAGSPAAAALLEAAPMAARVLDDRQAFGRWLLLIEELARLAPESIGLLLSRSEGLLGQLDLAAFKAWSLGGIRAAGYDPESRKRFFSFADPRAERWLQRESGEVELSLIERRLKLFMKAVWSLYCPIRRPVKVEGHKSPRRSSFEGQVIRMPEAFRGIAGQTAANLFRASAAHIAAHICFTGEKFPVASLKPLQIALISLIEDSRVEQLAIQHFPGLQRLWLPFHIAVPRGASTAPALLSRLARALIDPSFEDPNAWVRKGRRLFFERREDWHDQSISREIGGALGNDLGQMRIQFNAQTYVVEPPYRDDNLGIWDFGEDQESMEMETIYQSVQLRQELKDGKPKDEAPQVELLPEDEAVPIGKHPEWDYVIGSERPEWTTILDYPTRQGSLDAVQRVLDDYPVLINRITALIRSAKISRPVRQKRQPEGDWLDLDACIEAAVSRRQRETPDPRVYSTVTRRHRDLAVLLLLDISESTNDRVKGSYRRVLALERDAAILLSHAMTELGDPFAVRAFCSNGRDEVRYLRVKDFAEPFGDAAKRRLSALSAGLSTRIGAALRQGGLELSRQQNHRRLLLVITDGEPSDVDVADRKYLVEDARRAVSWLAHLGVDVFCVGLDSGGDSYLHRIFGRSNVLLIDRLDRLPEQLTSLYFRLTK